MEAPRVHNTRRSRLSRPRFLSQACTLLTFLFLLPTASLAQTYNVFLSFDGSDGGSPTYGALVQGSDGNFYGVGGASGSSGTIFKVTPQAVLTTLYSFATCLPNCPNGAGPNGSLVQGADGNFYGTTAFGGTGFQGTVFTITPQGQLTSLYSFCTQN